MSESPLPDLGVPVTLVWDSHSGSPRTVPVSEQDAWRDVGTGYLDDARIVSHWAFHVALYALQNPTPENIDRALRLIGASGDVDEHLNEETLRARPVPAPDGWDRA